jgi:hypothetical protein
VGAGWKPLRGLRSPRRTGVSFSSHQGGIIASQSIPSSSSEASDANPKAEAVGCVASVVVVTVVGSTGASVVVVTVVGSTGASVVTVVSVVIVVGSKEVDVDSEAVVVTVVGSKEEDVDCMEVVDCEEDVGCE